ncbi:MAG TPA: HAMP domain-containing protein, partial [Gemmataceae bacterium]|nr:HAMP domain-containing protein [Gemmataceae bacterium]
MLSAIGLLGAAIMNRVETNYQDLLKESLATRISLIDDVVHAHPAEPANRLQQQVQTLGAKIGTRITLLAEDGTVLADSEKDPAQMENHAGRPEVLAAKQSGHGDSSRFSQTLQQPMMYQALHTPDRGRIAYVRVALPLVRVQGQLTDLRVMIWTTAGLTSCAALVLAFWLARRNTWPLQELTAGTELIARGAYGHRVYAGDSDEIGTLARTFNHMSERLSTQFAQIEEDRQQLRAILGGMVEGVIALDADQRIVFANARASKLLGQSGGLPAGRKLWEVVRHRGLQEVVQRALVEVEPYHEELTWNGPGV